MWCGLNTNWSHCFNTLSLNTLSLSLSYGICSDLGSGEIVQSCGAECVWCKFSKPLWPSTLDYVGRVCTDWHCRTEQVFIHRTHNCNSCFYWLVPLTLACGQLIRKIQWTAAEEKSRAFDSECHSTQVYSRRRNCDVQRFQLWWTVCDAFVGPLGEIILDPECHFVTFSKHLIHSPPVLRSFSHLLFHFLPFLSPSLRVPPDNLSLRATWGCTRHALIRMGLFHVRTEVLLFCIRLLTALFCLFISFLFLAQNTTTSPARLEFDFHEWTSQKCEASSCFERCV